MRIIPVLDLKNGIAVHALRGERQTYQPVVSVLSPVADPLNVAAGFREQFGFNELYIADLDAILGQGSQHGLIRSLARRLEMNLIVDAGAANVEGVRQVLDLGARKVIIGAETLTNWEAATTILDTFPPEKLVFSLDMRLGKVLSAYQPLSALQPLDAIGKLFQAGWREIILLDLARVGAQGGIDLDLLGKARHAYPRLTLLVGGGVRHVNDLVALRSLGVDGALIATIIHRGILTREQMLSFGFIGA
jgi:phosphoribosylformimino-5-aminoimidazole carboxamide ribotide isomerase